MRLLRDQSVAARTTPVPGARTAPVDGAPPPPAPRRRARIAAAAVAAAVVAACAGAHWIATTRGFAVRRVIVQGAVHADASALARASAAEGVNTFRLDLDAVRARVLADPCIAGATVRRSLPHELRIAVEERIPVGALEGTAALVDASGGRLPPPVHVPAPRLPILAGLGGAGEARDAEIARMAASLAAVRGSAPALFERLERIRLAGARLELEAAGSPPIWISGPESADEVAAHAGRVETIRRAVGEVEYVDARWSGRLFVMRAGRNRGTS